MAPEQHEISVYPNPASGQVIISVPAPLGPAPLSGAVSWSLHNALGQEVASAVLSAGQQKAEVGLAGVAPGLYFWRVEAAEGSLGSGKLIVIK